MPTTDTPEYVDDRELATRTTLSRGFWQSMRSRGKGPPYYKVGKRCLYRLSEAMAWLEGHRTEPKKAG